MDLSETNSKYEPICKFFSAEEWTEMGDYEKDCCFAQYTNYIAMTEMGIGFKKPFFMCGERKEMSSDEDEDLNNLKRKRLIKRQEISSDDESTETVKLHVKRTVHTCCDCGETSFSNRLLMKHKCNSHGQSIAGRHLVTMEDKDLIDLGIKKGARIDILGLIARRKEDTLMAAPSHESNSTEQVLSGTRPSMNMDQGQSSRSSLPPLHPSSSVQTNVQFQSLNSDFPGQCSPLNDSRGPVLAAISSTSSMGLGLASHSRLPPLQSSSSVNANVQSTGLSSNYLGQFSSLNDSRGPVLAATSSTSSMCLGLASHSRLPPLQSSSSVNANVQSTGSSSNYQGQFSSLNDSRGPVLTSTSFTSSMGLGLASHSRLPPLQSSSFVNTDVQSTGSSSNDLGQFSSLNDSRGPVLTATSSTPSMQDHVSVTSSSRVVASCSGTSSSTGTSDYNSEDRVKMLIETAAAKLKCGFDILAILRSSRNGSLIASTLEKDGYVTDKVRKTMCNILVNHINKSGLSASPVVMREEIAILIALSFPKLRMKLHKRVDMPWHHWYNASTNTGFLENSNVGFQRAEKKLTGVGTRRSKKVPGAPRKLVELPTNRHDEEVDSPDPPEFTRDVQLARNLLPIEGEKVNILNLMQKTYERRRLELEFKEISDEYTLNRYPHFLSYSGEVIEQEFNLMYPKSSSLFLRSFSLDFVPKILKIAREKPDKYAEEMNYFGDELLNALLILSKILPTPRRSYAHEANQPLHPNKVDLINMIPLGTDPQVEIAKKRAAIRCPLQPHLMIKGHPKAMGQMYVVCGNGESFELHRQASPTNAVDLLFKTYFALNLHYPLGWKNVLRFLQVHVYRIPSPNERESTFEDIRMMIENTTL